MDPIYRCTLCGNHQVVNPDGSGHFPPAIAKKKLEKRCADAGCPCQPVYTAGAR